MAGLYIHIPFCTSRCLYCGFYSTTLSNLRERYVNAICHEMELRHDYLKKWNNNIETIYLGGGTPSTLSEKHLNQIFSYIENIYNGSPTEVTLECNPDDITPDYAEAICRLPINRISMGAQTFDDNRLQFLHRRHKANDVTHAVDILQKKGIENISIDLMFGFPGESLEDWENDIDRALELDIKHISAYSLMYEEGTPLFRLLKDGKIKEIDEELSHTMYETLIKKITIAGYNHYEISNFARHGFESKHNASYWHSIPYVGIGAAAHSYDINSRQWNINNVEKYISEIEKGIVPMEKEFLDDVTKYNDMITTALRTSDGINISKLKQEYKEYLLTMSEKYIKNGLMEVLGENIRITSKGLYISDDIMSDLIKI